MKHHNPHTPILIREALGIEPKIWTRYGSRSARDRKRVCTNLVDTEYGKEKMEPLTGLDDKGIESKVTEMVKASS